MDGLLQVTRYTRNFLTGFFNQVDYLINTIIYSFVKWQNIIIGRQMENYSRIERSMMKRVE